MGKTKSKIPKRETFEQKISHEMAAQELEKISDVDKEIIRLRITNPKITTVQIGKILGVTHQAISQRISKPKIRNILAALEQDVITQLQQIQAVAVQVIHRTLNGDDHKLALDAAKFLLQKAADHPDMIPKRFAKEKIISDEDFANMNEEDLSTLYQQQINEGA